MPKIGDIRHLDDGVYRVVDTGPLMIYKDVAAPGKRPRFEAVQAGVWTRVEKIGVPEHHPDRPRSRG